MANFNANPGNAFAGGVYAPASTPTGATGSLGQVGAGGFPQPGAAPILSARNNSGSNVRIPYARLVPMRGKELKHLMPNADESVLWRRLMDGRTTAREYDGLEGGELAWIHGRSMGSNGASSVGMLGKGVDRMQRLAFTSWLESYFRATHSSIILDLRQIQTDAFSSRSSEIAQYKSILSAIDPNDDRIGNLVNSKDVVGKLLNEPEMICGIFTMEKGPFLRGRINDNSLKQITIAHENRTNSTLDIPNNAGDLLAIEALHEELKNRNLLAWTPDGMVLSKLESPAGDPIGSAQLDAREAQMFNVAVQGPAITKTWTGDPKMQCLPMDKVFIVIQADVLTDYTVNTVLGKFKDADGNEKDLELQKLMESFSSAVETYVQAIKTDESTSMRDVEQQLDNSLYNKEFDEGAWDAKALRSKVEKIDGALMTNFHLRRVTSSYMSMYSAYKKGNDLSRCGLASKMSVGDGKAAARYIIGGWCIGTVMDSAASRASIGNQIRTAPATMALNINVNVEWWSGDKLHRNYMDVDGNVLGRQDMIQGPKQYSTVNKKETRGVQIEIVGAGDAAAGYREAAAFDPDLPTSLEAKRRSKSAIDDMDVDA